MSATIDDRAAVRTAAAVRPRLWLVDGSLVLMAIIWGVNFSVVKFGADLIDPLAYNGVRIAMAAAILLVIAAVVPGPLPSRRTIATLMALGVLGNGIYQYFFIEGLARASANDTALVVAASPAFIAIIGRLWGIEHIRRRAALGIGL
ncbi:MAG TPA: DMT family transporter, partial [Gemmatimonadaceae bacterium]|nr:DMT family transporter [Gemmatimonadaceae bacterium]